MSKAIVIGGGIMGLSSAYFLNASGWDVTVLDQSDFRNNCSYGNAGYICPSHFIPLATPGVVRKGLQWMFNSRSPFYVQPRLSSELISWGIQFIRSAKANKVEAAAVPLRDIALLSQQEYEHWSRMPELDFSYEHKGLLEIFQTADGEAHAKHTVKKAHELGLSDTRLLSRDELKAMEPKTDINAIGAIYFACDAHCYPNRLMQRLISLLEARGVQLLSGEQVKSFEKKQGSVSGVITNKSHHPADMVVVATGSWSRELLSDLGLRLPLVPGRGYSVTFENAPFKVNYPSILVEGRVAITPMDGNKIRFGGTMEITSTRTPPRYKRVEGILQAVRRFYPAFDIPMPSTDQIWYGFRPCSADGLPYIGKLDHWKNVVVATGHSMLGLSLGAGTGKLVAEIVNEKKASIDLRPFRVERFA